MIRDLFVTLQGGAADTAALEAAIALARAHEARVAALAHTLHQRGGRLGQGRERQGNGQAEGGSRETAAQEVHVGSLS